MKPGLRMLCTWYLVLYLYITHQPQRPCDKFAKKVSLMSMSGESRRRTPQVDVYTRNKEALFGRATTASCLPSSPPPTEHRGGRRGGVRDQRSRRACFGLSLGEKKRTFAIKSSCLKGISSVRKDVAQGLVAPGGVACRVTHPVRHQRHIQQSKRGGW